MILGGEGKRPEKKNDSEEKVDEVGINSLRSNRNRHAPLPLQKALFVVSRLEHEHLVSKNHPAILPGAEKDGKKYSKRVIEYLA